MMTIHAISRRRLLSCLPALLAARLGSVTAAFEGMLTVYTFGDSILDCSRYNEYGIDPGQLLVRNNDALYPEFKGHDLHSHRPARLEHRAVDGATVANLPAQTQKKFAHKGEALALLTVGGNDLLRGLAGDSGAGAKNFSSALDRFVRSLPLRPVFLGNVYDPTFGDDRANFLGVDARLARANHHRVNDIIASVAYRHGRLVDLHAHFLTGNPTWLTHTIEPSLTGASEIRRAFLAALGD